LPFVLAGLGALGLIGGAYYFGPTIGEMWAYDPKLEERYRESRNKVLASEEAMFPRKLVIPQGGLSIGGSWKQQDPVLRDDLEDGTQKAGVLAAVGIFWAASGPGFVSPSGKTFFLKGKDWFTASGEIAEGADAAAAEKALTSAPESAPTSFWAYRPQ